MKRKHQSIVVPVEAFTVPSGSHAKKSSQPKQRKTSAKNAQMVTEAIQEQVLYNQRLQQQIQQYTQYQQQALLNYNPQTTGPLFYPNARPATARSVTSMYDYSLEGLVTLRGASDPLLQTGFKRLAELHREDDMCSEFMKCTSMDPATLMINISHMIQDLFKNEGVFDVCYVQDPNVTVVEGYANAVQYPKLSTDETVNLVDFTVTGETRVHPVSLNETFQAFRSKYSDCIRAIAISSVDSIEMLEHAEKHVCTVRMICDVVGCTVRASALASREFIEERKKVMNSIESKKFAMSQIKLMTQALNSKGHQQRQPVINNNAEPMTPISCGVDTAVAPFLTQTRQAVQQQHQQYQQASNEHDTSFTDLLNQINNSGRNTPLLDQHGEYVSRDVGYHMEAPNNYRDQVSSPYNFDDILDLDFPQPGPQIEEITEQVPPSFTPFVIQSKTPVPEAPKQNKPEEKIPESIPEPTEDEVLEVTSAIFDFCFRIIDHVLGLSDGEYSTAIINEMINYVKDYNTKQSQEALCYAVLRELLGAHSNNPEVAFVSDDLYKNTRESCVTILGTDHVDQLDSFVKSKSDDEKNELRGVLTPVLSVALLEIINKYCTKASLKENKLRSKVIYSIIHECL